MSLPKSAIKSLAGTLAPRPPFKARMQRELHRRIGVVYLHYVGPCVPYYEAFYEGSTADRLDRDLEVLGRYFDFAPLRDVVADESEGDGRPRLAVTFDDGFDVVQSGADAVLEAHGISATTFVILDTVDNRNLMWRNKLATVLVLADERRCVERYNELTAKAGEQQIVGASELLDASARWAPTRKDELADSLWQGCGLPPLNEFLDEHRPYFTWSGLERWLQRGHAVGLHTKSHPSCAKLDDGGVRTEIVEPADVLRERLGLDFLPFSYPFGSRLPSSTEEALCRDGVIDCALGIRGFAPRGTPCYHLERACIEDDLEFAVFARACAGLPRKSAKADLVRHGGRAPETLHHGARTAFARARVRS